MSKAKASAGLLDELVDVFDSVADVVNGDVFDGLLDESPAAPKVDVSNERAEPDNTPAAPSKPIKPIKPGSTFKPASKKSAEPEPAEPEPAE